MSGYLIFFAFFILLLRITYSFPSLPTPTAFHKHCVSLSTLIFSLHGLHHELMTFCAHDLL